MLSPPGWKRCAQLHCEVYHSQLLCIIVFVSEKVIIWEWNSLLLCTFHWNRHCSLGNKLDLPTNSTVSGLDTRVSKGLCEPSIPSPSLCNCGGPDTRSAYSSVFSLPFYWLPSRWNLNCVFVVFFSLSTVSSDLFFHTFLLCVWILSALKHPRNFFGSCSVYITSVCP